MTEEYPHIAVLADGSIAVTFEMSAGVWAEIVRDARRVGPGTVRAYIGDAFVKTLNELHDASLSDITPDTATRSGGMPDDGIPF